ncbi:hypothetical protein [Chryseobacterium sp. Alg-005]|uniref:hypothetical protein n=1 Tax=Chryseobacterium sp. Alg-005 TaxID=3159516 RepID=UPI0036F4375A
MKTDTLDQAKVTELIQKGILVPLPVNLGAAPNHKEPTYETIQKQDYYVSGMVFNWGLQFESDACLSRSLSALSSKAWDLLEVDEDGFLNVVYTSDGFIKGFDLNLARLEGMQDNDGTVSAKQTFRIELTKPGSIEYMKEWDTIAPTEVKWMNLQGIDEVLLTQTVDDKIKVTFACDQSSPIDGLLTANFRALDSSGAAVAGFAVTAEGEGVYAVTGLTAGQDYTISLYDSIKNTRVIVLANYFYKSDDLKYTA